MCSPTLLLRRATGSEPRQQLLLSPIDLLRPVPALRPVPRLYDFLVPPPLLRCVLCKHPPIPSCEQVVAVEAVPLKPLRERVQGAGPLTVTRVEVLVDGRLSYELLLQFPEAV